MYSISIFEGFIRFLKSRFGKPAQISKEKIVCIASIKEKFVIKYQTIGSFLVQAAQKVPLSKA